MSKNHKDNLVDTSLDLGGALWDLGKMIYYELKLDSKKVANVKLYTTNYQGNVNYKSKSPIKLRTSLCTSRTSAYSELKQKAVIKGCNTVINAYCTRFSHNQWIAYGDGVNR